MSTAATATRNNDDDTCWSLSVKAIGTSTLKATTEGGDDNGPEKNFTVTVSPEDALTKLYDQIEGVTGLKACQQRLIYRGRLIDEAPTTSSPSESNGDDDGDDAKPKGQLKVDPDEQPKIKDIVGLGDGHTIHLVKRKETPQQSSNNNSQSDSANTTGSNSNTTTNASGSSTLDRDETLSGNGTASLLAALIGMGGLDDGDSADASAGGGGRQRLGFRSGRLGGRSRRPHYRLTADDLQTPDPGTLEPVRQGLMTIHTMLPHAQVTDGSDLTSPLDCDRRWFRGQWIDVRDTVNQWLEATVVSILTPDDILGVKEVNDDEWENSNKNNGEPILEPAVDPAVSAGDLEGRRQLLLEPCDVGDPGDEGGELSGFRRRKSNEKVKILLIHYNGWPHRWDEWIRSDSERIRPFRTRTRHPNAANHASPTTQSAFNDSPPTHILDSDNSLERPAILPELSRAVSAINDLLSAVSAEETAQLSQEHREDLPWAVRTNSTGAEGGALDICSDHDEDDLEDLPPLDAVDVDTMHMHTAADMSASSNTHHSCSHPRLRRRQLQMLAPLLDRLGRTLIDSAPHVAALARAAPPDNDTEESISTAEAVVAPQPGSDDNPSTLGGLLSLLSRDRRRQNNSDDNDGVSPANNDQPWPVDPDYVDFATGTVNTTRGEVRSGPRSRSSNDSDVAGLLGAYLAAASLGLNPGGGASGSGDNDNNDDNASNVLGLGRLLRDRGGGGGGNGAGIDIHIHAVVTAPGMPPTAIGGGGGGGGGLGFAALGSPPTAANVGLTRNSLSPSTRDRRGSGGNSLVRLRTPAATEEEDDGLFSELYSESPDPIDPYGSPGPDPNRGGRDASATIGENDFLSRLGSTPRDNTSSARDPFASSPSRHSSASDASSRRSSTNGSSPRRPSSMLGRLFRRRSSSRRSSG